MADKLNAVKGMNDILPPESARWEWLEATVRDLMGRFAYRNVRTPILERTALFVRGIGEVTDIVEKEMYSFEDRADKHGKFEHLTMRPENTAGLVRAVIEHNMLYEGPKRLWYTGPMFRRENVQRGRFRQFHQIGAEALGFAGPDVDAELILLANALWKAIGLTDVRLELNSLGQPAERALHRTELIAHFEKHADKLDEDGKRRLHSNPLRILDTKNPAMKDVVESAPKLIDFLGAESLAHFEGLQAILKANDIAFTINPRLVRGLDYYNLSVFEFVTDRLGSQGTVCAGGRYDDLIAQIGGKPAPAVGWAMGVERVLDLLKEQGAEVPAPVPDAYAIVPDAASMPVALRTLQQLRESGVRVQMHAATVDGLSGFKAQMKKADASGATYALIFGADELARGEVTLKALRDGSGAQTSRALAEAPIWAATLQSPAPNT
ncbi:MULTISPECIES: histidine--tRNA ligase [Variovorax]|jgi:histidyl-tRNA synthetase|uniref:histidine--tRNA ligase n=1 Tax=Variovorax TaxID=34072 RepID=UPI000868B485|nr:MULTISPECIES: histidine--tRNA ligase [Variovorax]MBN8753119.1 histidine--tRNA ligase [Variovorax sp.]ODU11600.1 MAG: histidine--tRNA ligase [Variovorax sp. SCN 67-85]ODV15035.1 MAG: histidine--tRNA ligase [Variovorax sp. SCN 67-20]OJZ05245.1 MAG: histidine--tRNA ligase [Variovorax sp. 67-131]UKI05322.1 histidine--tRNA ligase [Variovorax paradoxus]